MRARTLFVVLHASLGSFPSSAASAERTDVLFEDGFEQGELGAPPSDWFGPPMGPRGAVVAEDAFQGERCARIDLTPDGAEFGNLIAASEVDFETRRRLALSAAVRVDGAQEGRAQLWLRFDYDDGESVLVDNMGERPITAGDWAEHRIVADVAPKPGTAVLGLMVFDGARAHLDEVRLEDLGPSPAAIEPPRPLTARGLANLTALARLLGVVRYFHPSDEVAETDWEAFAVDAVRRVEGAGDADELRAVLVALFAPIAPTVAIHPSGVEPPPHPATLAAPDERAVRARAWSHRGMGRSQIPNRVYASRRRNERVRDGELPDDFVAPDAPFRTELGAGLACAVPLTLYSNRAGTIPPGVLESSEQHGELPALTGRLQTEQRAEDRATRLASVVLCWNVFQHFYPYFDVVEVDWPAELTRALEAAAEDADAQAFLRTLERLVAALDDGHGMVMNTIAPSRPGRLPLGLELIDGALVVTWVDGTAEGLALGDVVEAIGGVPMSERLSEAEARISAATPQYMRYMLCRELRQGEAHEPVTLRIQRDGARGGLEVEVAYSDIYPWIEEPRFGAVTELHPGYWYVDLGAAQTDELLEVIDEVAAARGVVFDMRGYPRGIDAFRFFPHLIDEPVESPHFQTPLFTRPDREGVEWLATPWKIEPAEPYIKAKRVFITDGRAISYAESCMGIVEHYRLGEILGEATAGTNGNINPFLLPGGYQVNWTGMRVLKQDGGQHHGVGIQPTIPVSRTRAGIAEGRDELLDAAFEALYR